MPTENTNTAFIKLKPINELEEITTIESGNLLFEDGDGNLKRITTEIFYQLLNNFAKPISPSDSGPFTANSWYKPSVYSSDPGANYPNAGNLKAIEGFDTLFFYTGSTWSKVSNKLPGLTAQTTFDPADNVNPATMKATYDASGDMVDNAFLQVGGPAGLFSYGTNTTYTDTSTTANRIYANNVVGYAGKLTKITIAIPTGRTSIAFVILQKLSAKKYKTIKYFEKLVTPGSVNVLALDYDIPANCTVGVVFNGLPLGFSNTGGSGFLEFSNYDMATEGAERDYAAMQVGYLAYTFEITGTGLTFEEGIQLLKNVRSGGGESAGSTRTFNVMSYGAKGDGVTDDRIAIQNTINACFDAGGGKVYFPTPSQFYWIGTDLTTASQVSGDVVPNIDKAQLIIPANTNTTRLITIELVGEYKVNMADEAVQSVGRSSKGFIKSGLIKTGSSSNYDGSSIFGTAYPTTNLWYGKNYIHVHMENLIIRSESMQGATNIDNFVHGINFERLTQFTFNYLKVEKSSVIFNSVEPTKSIGIIMPSVNNKAQLGEGSAFVAGWYIGVQQGEHFNAHRLILLGCVHGLGWPTSTQNNTYHSASIMHLNTECCRNVFLIQGGGKHVLNVFNADVEHHNEVAKWYNYATDIVKSGTTEGSLNIFNYQVVKSAVGNVNEFVTQGNPTYKILTGVGAN